MADLPSPSSPSHLPSRNGRLPGGTLLLGSAALGIGADLILRAPGGPGIGILLLFAILTGALALVCRRMGIRPAPETLGWVLGGLLLAFIFVVRSAPPLHFMAFLGAAAAFAFAALKGGERWLEGSGLTDAVEAVAGALLHSALGPLHLLFGGRERRTDPAGIERRTAGEGAHSTEGRGGDRFGSVVRGLLLALPFLAVFGALLVGADPVFEGMLLGLLPTMDVERLLSHLAVMGVVGWLAFGYLSGFAWGTRFRERIAPALPRPRAGITEIGIALGLVNTLFAIFVLVQLRYLFGGSAMVEVTPGLTYAEYAREGFAQLVLVVALVFPFLLLSDWLLERSGPRADGIFRILGGLQLLLLLVVIASAFQRVRAYQDAYGLTEPRFYGVALLVWLTLVGGWLAATVLRGRRDRFAPAVLVSGLAMIALLAALNPDARIASANLARSGEVDGAYLVTLSADAVPTLARALPGLPPERRCAVARALEEREDALAAERDWRTWNLAEVRAGRILRGLPPGLLSTEGCPEASVGRPRVLAPIVLDARGSSPIYVSRGGLRPGWERLPEVSRFAGRGGMRSPHDAALANSSLPPVQEVSW